MSKEIDVTIKVVDYGRGAQLNARAAIEQVIYAIADNKLAGTDAISAALEWWTEEVYEVLGEDAGEEEAN